MIGLFRFGLIAVLLAGIACVSAIVTMQFAVHSSVVKVPDVHGMAVDAAVSRAARLGLDLSVTQRFYSTALPAGQVLLQTPLAGAQVRRGWDIAVAESLGPRRIAIPDVRGRSEHDAVLLIRQKGLELGAVAHLPDAGVTAGTVLAQDPDADARGAAQPSVSLLIAGPTLPEAPAWVMPDERGRSYADANASLAHAGLHVESAQGAPPGAQVVLSANTSPGTVLAQSPPAGARVDAASHIVLYVSGPPAAAGQDGLAH